MNSGAESFELSAAGRVRAVRPNPRHDAIVWSRSTQLGDPTMSATVDGRDLIRCARLEGAQALVDNPESVYDVNIDFDPRCDFDDDGDIDATDLDTIIAAFGEGVTS